MIVAWHRALFPGKGDLFLPLRQDACGSCAVNTTRRTTSRASCEQMAAYTDGPSPRSPFRLGVTVAITPASAPIRRSVGHGTPATAIFRAGGEISCRLSQRLAARPRHDRSWSTSIAAGSRRRSGATALSRGGHGRQEVHAFPVSTSSSSPSWRSSDVFAGVKTVPQGFDWTVERWPYTHVRPQRDRALHRIGAKLSLMGGSSTLNPGHHQNNATVAVVISRCCRRPARAAESEPRLAISLTMTMPSHGNRWNRLLLSRDGSTRLP